VGDAGRDPPLTPDPAGDPAAPAWRCRKWLFAGATSRHLRHLAGVTGSEAQLQHQDAGEDREDDGDRQDQATKGTSIDLLVSRPGISAPRCDEIIGQNVDASALLIACASLSRRDLSRSGNAVSLRVQPSPT
jgi:hypothetical protein